MRKGLLVILAVMVGMCLVLPSNASAYNYGDYRSVTLVSKAWGAMANEDLDAVLAYTNKCMELYGKKAKEMQESLSDFAQGTNDEIFAYWALNDVATGLFVQGEAYRKAGMMDEAKAAYQKVIDEYAYGQCYDNGGWFWKPSEAAKEKIYLIESGSDIDFGDYTSSTLTTKAWGELNDQNLEGVLAYTNKCIELYEAKANEMQSSMTEYAWEDKDKIFSYWALNDVGTSYFIQGEAYKQAGMIDEAKKAYQQVVDNYYFAQCWDTKGWFWKPAEGAQQKLDELSES